MVLLSKITTCTLHLPASQPLSLQALQALPHLQCLALHSGLYCDIDAAEHLTSLSMTRAQAECTHSCLCVTSLVQLELESSTIIGLHANGLAACSCLEALRCMSSDICASDQAAAVDRQEVQICASISSLTGLTKLKLGMYTQDAQVELCWLSRLSSLNRLWLEVDVHQAKLSNSFVTLSNLMALSLIGGSFQFDFEWGGLPALQNLFCAGSSAAIGFMPHLIDVAAVRSLRTVTLADKHFCVAKTAFLVKTMVQWLQYNRPQVETRIC